MTVDYLVVGSGLTGATIARKLADAGREVLVVDRRSHAGGNVHDFVHESGVRIHTYGPHYFRTNSEDLWRFVNQLSPFYRFEAVLKTEVDGKLENWPVAASYVRRTVGESWKPGFTGTPTNFEEASLSMMPRAIYEKFVRGYTEKQWGVAASSLSANLAKRFDVRQDDEPRLMRHAYQGIPVHGYAHWMNCLLQGIPVMLNWDYLTRRDEIQVRKSLVFTGPVDEFFGFDLGRLRYRGQQREHLYLAGQDLAQPVVQVNNPDPGNGPHIRTIEWKHAMAPNEASGIRGTVLTKEVPFTPDNPQHFEYPFPDEVNAALYAAYRRRAEASDKLLVCGRLGEYRYYDMDQAIGRALMLASRLLSSA
jgi:UDP-galactopyranose mutase